MNIGEANDTAKVLRALADLHDEDVYAGGLEPDADLLATMRRLAERAAKPLQITADAILEPPAPVHRTSVREVEDVVVAGDRL